jgi:excisionase family DNA binding protein
MKTSVASAVLTPEQAAAELQLHPNTVYKLLADGALPGRKVGKSWRIPRVRLMEWLEQR